MVPWGTGGNWEEGGGCKRGGGEFSFLGSGWGPPPSSRLTRRQRGIGLCHTLITVNTI